MSFFENNSYYSDKNNLANDGPFRAASIFSNINCDQLSTKVNSSPTDYERLATDLVKRTDSNFIFDWEKYQSRKEVVEAYSTNPKELDRMPAPSKSAKKTFSYTEDKVEKQGHFSVAKLNYRKCGLDRTIGNSIYINSADRKISFALFAYYKDVIKKAATDTENPDDFRVADEYKAVQLYTPNASHYTGFMKRIGLRGDALVKRKFTRAFSEVNSNGDLDWLYERTPDFVINEKDKLVLWEDLLKLLAFDKDKWFIDSSVAMIKVLKGILSKENGAAFLYEQFEANPQIIREIYYNMDKSGKSALHENKLVPNKTIFASLLANICYHDGLGFTNSDRVKTAISFKVGPKHRVDSNVLMGNASKATFDLTQEVKRWSSSSYAGIPTQTPGPITNWKKEGGTQSLHPLDMVLLIIEGGEEPFQMTLPAIMVKDMAHRREKKEIDAAMRVGFNLLAIAFGIASLGTGVPWITALAAADIGLAGTDLFVQGFKEAIMNVEGGEKFLQLWEKIYTFGGLGVALASAPQLVQSVLSLGVNVYRLVTGSSREVLKKILVSAILEMHAANFAKNTLKNAEIGRTVLARSGVQFNIRGLERLEREGVLFIGLLDEADNVVGYSVMHNGLIIAYGKADEVKAIIEPLMRKSGKGLKRAIDDLKPSSSSSVVWKTPDSPGKMGGQGLTQKEGIELERILKENYDTKCIRYADVHFSKRTSLEIEGFRGSFLDETEPGKFLCHISAQDQVKMGIALQEGATMYIVFHELMHLKDALGQGAKAFINQGKYLGDRVNKYMKERYVFDRIIENEKLFTQDELKHAQLYINYHIERANKSPKFDNLEEINLDFSGIPTKRPAISLNELFKIANL